MRELTEFMKVLGVIYNDQSLLDTALTHRSYLNENKNVREHNERLEFLGDDVLELVVTEYLYQNYPNPEGELTNWRSALVKTETISDVSRELGVENYLLMSKGEAKSFGRSRQLLLANAFEAISGSIYLDQGYDVAKKFISQNLLTRL
jgi:ribonuclease-3